MPFRPAWLEAYRVKKKTSTKSEKSIYIDRNNKVVKPTHYSLQGGSYHVPRSQEGEFVSCYIAFVFGDTNGRLALTEAPLHTPLGNVYSPVFIDLDLRYPINSAGQ